MPHSAGEDNISIKRKRLIFRSWHRGTREIVLMLGGFADAHLPAFNADELDLYEQFLSNSDPDIYNWITGQEPLPTAEGNEVTFKILDFFASKKCH